MYFIARELEDALCGQADTAPGVDRIHFRTVFPPPTSTNKALHRAAFLNSTIFNILMGGLIVPHYDQGIKLLIYADDIVLLYTGTNFVVKRALLTFTQQCRELGLKVNSTKSRFIVFKAHLPDLSLQLDGQPITQCYTH
ncbi:hypothetical protein E2C01_027733 [Portunus trituberculatus]|uniref:Reverse transcriptase domain-containing protein n=1 Tax=Portunus trituberculatus TaxID=210409 RepID=A0A5B7ELZ3_PORTR|nr:hypothetical protein [Portunus trituberculatus]